MQIAAGFNSAASGGTSVRAMREEAARAGLTFGTALAPAIAWLLNTSLFWAAVRGLLRLIGDCGRGHPGRQSGDKLAQMPAYQEYPNSGPDDPRPSPKPFRLSVTVSREMYFTLL